MRFMIMHKNDPRTEAGQPPPMEMVHEMGAFIGEYARTGRLIDGAGLGASATRTRLVFKKGECTAQQGPYRGERELPAATLLLKVRTRDEALGWAGRTPQQMAALARLKTEMTEAGVLVRSMRLQPSAKARRLIFTSNQMRMLDGPFVESKELIGGFAVMELSGMEEAIEMCRRYTAILGGTLEIDLRLVEAE